MRPRIEGTLQIQPDRTYLSVPSEMITSVETTSVTPYLSERAADRQARAWLSSVDPKAKVGTRHHIVPRFYLERFATNGQLRVRDTASGASSLRSISDMAVKDYYTTVDLNGNFDSRFEDLLADIEGEAAPLLRTLSVTFAKPHIITPESRATLDLYVAFQAARGQRARRTHELLTNYTQHLLGPDTSTTNADTVHIPHQNEHIQMMGQLAARIQQSIATRPVGIIRIDQPLIITCDEPVLLADLPKQAQHCSIGGRSTIDYRGLRRTAGLADCHLILLPIDPHHIVLYGPRHADPLAPRQQFSGTQASELGTSVANLVIESAHNWAAAHPQHPTFSAVEFPTAGPILSVQGAQHDANISMDLLAKDRSIRRRLWQSSNTSSSDEPMTPSQPV